jgi:AraC family transcriptional regulator, regulatory protein of adaptative response / methylphosphotriester-DNA alkyltransferase methyltransferase
LLFYSTNLLYTVLWFILKLEVNQVVGIPDDYWKAIIECDSSYDETIIYAVKTTGIYCRPSCRSRVPNRGNVRIFKNSYIAMKEGYRPCKRCKPDGASLPAEEWVRQIAAWIESNYSAAITLNEIAELFHGSPFHLQRVFKRVQGISPTEFLQKIRMEKAIVLLQTSEKAVSEIAAEIGFQSTPYFITLFKKKFGCTPAAYRRVEREK